MKIVAENHAERLRRPGCFSSDALIAAVIGEGLRENYEHETIELPDTLLALVLSLDGVKTKPMRDQATDHAAIS